MSAVPFDTLKLTRKLEAAGFQPKQAADTAEALAEVMTDQVATKGDPRELAGELKIWTAGLAGVIIAALSAMKFFSN